jgi:hypothetical protein
MGAQAETLASQFEQVNNDLISSIQGLTDAQWKAVCSGEGWSVGVTAHHIAGGLQPITGLVQMLAAGQTAPISQEQIDQGNAQHAKDAANCTKEETLAMLRENGRAAAAAVRALSDGQLGQAGTIFGNPMTAQQGIEMILIGHVQHHGASIAQATA